MQRNTRMGSAAVAEDLAVAQDGDGAVLADRRSRSSAGRRSCSGARTCGASRAGPATDVSASGLGTSRTPSSRRIPAASNTAAPSICARAWRSGARSDGRVMSSGGGVGSRTSIVDGPASSGRNSSSAPMPRAPRSWTANSSSSRSTSTPPYVPHAVTASIHDEIGGSWNHVRPSHRSTPCSPTMRTDPLGWRCTIVAPIASASTTRSRSEPAGRSNTAHSSSPLKRRISQLARPSANRRERFSGIASIGRRVTSSPDPDSQLRPASADGSMIVPTLGTRRSWTCGRSA